MKADLHVHTTASDGRLEPREIVSLAVKVGLDAIAITDHDTVGGVVPALAAAEVFPSFVVIPGVEINTDVPHGEVHILGYFIDYTDRKLAIALQRLRDSRRERAQQMIAKLRSLGMKIEWQRVSELAQGGSVCRPHIAQALFEKSYVGSEKEAFDKYIGHDGPAYVERYKLLPAEAVKLILDAQGLPVLAHPIDILDLNEFVPKLKSVGLIGIEVYYRDYSSGIIEELLKVANQHALVPTGGTDYHAFGDGLEVMIGGALTPAQSVERLFALADKHSLELPKQHKL
ncbi:MAG: PHP domain-containing protein [Chloroflexi bacterium]|nr:PHP domain-containing protein [Chloroflexota bacterium]